MAMSIKTGNIVEVYSPLLCGSWPDLKMFTNKPVLKLSMHKKIISDKKTLMKSVCQLKNFWLLKRSYTNVLELYTKGAIYYSNFPSLCATVFDTPLHFVAKCFMQWPSLLH